MKRLSTKVIILYSLLAALNISVFTIFIHQNQMNLITENKKYATSMLAKDVYNQLTAFINEINADTQGKYSTTAQMIEELSIRIRKTFNFKSSDINNGKTSKKFVTNIYALFDENGTLLYSNKKDFNLTAEHRNSGARAIKNKDLEGNAYYIKMDDLHWEVHFYFPFQMKLYNQIIVYFSHDIIEIKEKTEMLYNMVFIVIIGMALFHFLFAFFLNQFIIHPISTLSKTSSEISSGNLDARVKVKRRDEIGQLGDTFNSMADSIQDKISRLSQQNDTMLMELKMAGEVQEHIYPVPKKTERFVFSIYHRPLFIVSGDFHDVIALDKNRYGILIADVSGHGVSAALITMQIQDCFRRNAANYNDSKDLLIKLNTEFGNMMQDYNKYFSAFYLIVDDRGIINYANAGHPKAYLYMANINKIAYLETKGCLIGLSPDMNSNFESRTAKLSTGDKIILLSDGILEARNENREDFNPNRFIRAMFKYKESKADVMLAEIINEKNAFVGNAQARDDETLIIIQFTVQ